MNTILLGAVPTRRPINHACTERILSGGLFTGAARKVQAVIQNPAAVTLVTVRSCRYFGPEVAVARRSVRPVPDRACGSASVRANRVAMRFQCPTPFLTLAITPLRSASIAIWQALRTAPYRHDRTVTYTLGPGLTSGLAAMGSGTHSYRQDQRNRDILVNINSELAPRDQAVVSVFDSGFVLGDGIWEGLWVHNPSSSLYPSLAGF